MRKGSKMTKEQCLKISNGKKGCVPWNKGININIPKTEKWYKAMKEKMSGINNPRWIEDRSKIVVSEKKHLDSKYKIWMFAVKNRDKWLCRIADVNCDGRLEAHHILNWKQYTELRYEVNNGITLCHAHHPRGRENEAKLSPYLQRLVAEIK